MPRFASIRSLATASALSIQLVGGAVLAPVLNVDGTTVEARVPTKEHPETELEAIARSKGWTMDQARAYLRTRDALDDVLDAIEAEAPGIITGSGFAEDPEAPPTIWIKGPSTPAIDAIVAGADVPILLVDDQPWSFDENEERLYRVQQALLGLDLGFFKLNIDITARSTILAKVARTSGITDEEAAAIVASLPEDLRGDVDLIVIDPPIDALLCDAPPEAPSASASPAPASSASPSPSASPDPIGASCLDLPPGWGPLVVIDDPAIGGSDRGLGPGRLSVGPRCVTLRMGKGERITLMWRAGDTRWDPDTREILFVDRDLGLLRLSDGDRMTLGGFPAGTVASPTRSGFELRTWLTVPDAACPAPLWEVHQVVPGRR